MNIIEKFGLMILLFIFNFAPGTMPTLRLILYVLGIIMFLFGDVIYEVHKNDQES